MRALVYEALNSL